jgi:hypothetical protein
MRMSDADGENVAGCVCAAPPVMYLRGSTWLKTCFKITEKVDFIAHDQLASFVGPQAIALSIAFSRRPELSGIYLRSCSSHHPNKPAPPRLLTTQRSLPLSLEESCLTKNVYFPQNL